MWLASLVLFTELSGFNHAGELRRCPDALQSPGSPVAVCNVVSSESFMGAFHPDIERQAYLGTACLGRAHVGVS